MLSKKLVGFLNGKSRWVRKETLNIHRITKEPRLASSLSCVEIFVVLCYGKIIKFNSSDVKWEKRDRFIISKSHGAISLYPILADLGYFDKKELTKVCKDGSLLGAIPDPNIPGFETINGSLGHGLGVACGMAMALRRKKRNEKVFVLVGDGELNEGSVWEAIMFAGEHKLDNLILIIDNNKACMLDYCKNVLDLEPLDEKFKVFRWETKTVDGHDVTQLHNALNQFKKQKNNKPKVLIANTVKGKGITRLETDSLSHIRVLTSDEINKTIEELK